MHTSDKREPPHGTHIISTDKQTDITNTLSPSSENETSPSIAQTHINEQGHKEDKLLICIPLHFVVDKESNKDCSTDLKPFFILQNVLEQMVSKLDVIMIMI